MLRRYAPKRQKRKEYICHYKACDENHRTVENNYWFDAVNLNTSDMNVIISNIKHIQKHKHKFNAEAVTIISITCLSD